MWSLFSVSAVNGVRKSQEDFYELDIILTASNNTAWEAAWCWVLGLL